MDEKILIESKITLLAFCFTKVKEFFAAIAWVVTEQNWKQSWAGPSKQDVNNTFKKSVVVLEQHIL